MSWIKNLFNKNDEKTDIIEWRTENSILQFLSSNVDNDGSLKDTAHSLPDEISNEEEEKLKFAPGLMDAMFGENDSSESKQRVRELSKLLMKISKTGNQNSQSKFYKDVTDNDSVIGIIDQFLGHIIDLGLSTDPFLFKFAGDLAFKTNKRNSVKFGIAILGLCQNKSVIPQIKILGLHDEFTVFSTLAIANLSNNLADDLWDLAKKVDGWGKIQLVDRFAEMQLSKEQRQWLIRDGYRNNIMYEYLALTCAINGRLSEELAKDVIDEGLFVSSGEIIEALAVEGGPAADISDYEDASKVTQNYLRHAMLHTKTISDFLTLHKIKDFLNRLLGDMSAHSKNGWTEDIVANCLIEVEKILNGRDWTPLTMDALNSDDYVKYWNGKQAAKKLGIDLTDIVWKRLVQNPDNSTNWYDAVHYTKPENVDQIIEFALKTIPLDQLSIGPKDSLGIGPKYSQYQPLDYVITFLENYPGKGEKIILTGLNSPVTRNRNMSIKVLDKWTQKYWTENIWSQLKILEKIEPSKDTKENINRLLSGQELK